MYSLVTLTCKVAATSFSGNHGLPLNNTANLTSLKAYPAEPGSKINEKNGTYSADDYMTGRAFPGYI
jgi:hypothetical protein